MSQMLREQRVSCLKLCGAAGEQDGRGSGILYLKTDRTAHQGQNGHITDGTLGDADCGLFVWNQARGAAEIHDQIVLGVAHGGNGR